VEGFHSGRKGIGDEDCSGCPTTSYMADSVEGIDTFVQEERQCSISSKEINFLALSYPAKGCYSCLLIVLGYFCLEWSSCIANYIFLAMASNFSHYSSRSTASPSRSLPVPLHLNPTRVPLHYSAISIVT
jgi:hypothetical protein